MSSTADGTGHDSVGDAVRAQLEQDLLALEQALTPESLSKRVVSGVKDFYTHADGGVNLKRVAVSAGVVAGLLVLRKIL